VNNNVIKLLDFIPFGHENAISQNELSIRLNANKRTVRQLVFETRKKGAVICSTCDSDGLSGYYRPLSAAEARPYVKMQRSRIASAEAALKSAEEYIRNQSETGGDNVVR
jgi:transcription initiation factor IIE alpha subunit